MRVAAAQARPHWLDSAATTGKVVEWIENAAAEQVELLTFPETFLSGYPSWLEHTGGARFENLEQKRAYAAYLGAAVEMTGPELALITEAVHDLGVFVYLGTTERSGGTIFCTLVAIDPAAGIVSTHRKLMPTYEERLVWGIGDGHGLRVHPVGPTRVGGLNCWENWMPQARHALYAQSEELHVSVWPGNPHNTADLPRFIAREGRVFCLAANGLLSLADVPADFPLRTALEAAELTDYCRGGSAIAAPDGTWVVEPVVDEERLVIADLDFTRVREERQNFDPTGHYSRPDVFSVEVDRRRRIPTAFRD
ncbi:carbon-nitrogen hydrolase family protein [Fodinicola feengrottensis]|uniref:Carbon-nitrogen hydrolase family protein n=1 Tax=Fodinicola feengrottensis TaxID=435914 RepID=A0ABP4USL4_9ACTN